MGRVTNFLNYDVPLATFVLIAPYWKGAPWFSRLLLLAEYAYLLPK